MKVFLAVPTYRGLKCKPFLDSLGATVEALIARGHEGALATVEGDCYVQHARNELVRQFRQSDADVLLFLDDDLSWDANEAVGMLESGKSVICGAYRRKQAEEDYPVAIYTDSDFRPLVSPDGCIAASDVPTGFLAIKREVIEKIAAAYPHLEYVDYKDMQEIAGYFDFFPQGVHNRRWWGEDFAFCRLCRDIAIPIWIYPNMTFSHWRGAEAFTGNYHNFLLGQPGGSNDSGRNQEERAGSTAGSGVAEGNRVPVGATQR